MHKEEFLSQLEKQLWRLTPEERESALSYYREYLEEAGTDEFAAIEALGSPQSVAERIIREIGENRVTYGTGQSYQYEYPLPEEGVSAPHSDGGRIGLTVLVIIVTFPIWITVFCLWVGLIASLFAILGGMGFAAVAAPIQGLIELFSGEMGEALHDIGAGLFGLGFVLLCWKPFWLALKYSAIGLFRLAKACIRGLMGKENEA